jgi:MarR family transcriptional regulator for hemolysin
MGLRVSVLRGDSGAESLGFGGGVTLNSYTELFELVGVLARRRYQVGERAFARLGLNHTEARILSLLDRQDGVATQDALSAMLTIDRSNAGRALQGLEREEFVVRRKDEGDARTRLVRMTPKGREAAGEIAKIRGEMARTFFGDLTEEEAGAIVEHLVRSMKLELGGAV